MRKWTVKDIYDKYLWEKCSMSVYYQRVRKWIDPFKALKPVENKIDVRSKKFSKELFRYHKQPSPKPTRWTFYQRLVKWYPKEEAIRIDLVKRERKPLNYNYKTYEPTYWWQKKKEQKDYFWIWIKYKDEESDVIKKEYEHMINELESLIVEDEEERKSLNIRIEELKKEYHDFISNNTATNESM